MDDDALELFRALTVATVRDNPGASCVAVAEALAIELGHAELLLERLNIDGTLSEKNGRYYIARSKRPTPPPTHRAKAGEPQRVVSPSGRGVDVVYQRR